MLSYTPPASQGGYIGGGPLGQAGFDLLPKLGRQHIVRPAWPALALLGRSSIGRATVFGTAGWRFESSRPSQPCLAGHWSHARRGISSPFPDAHGWCTVPAAASPPSSEFPVTRHAAAYRSQHLGQRTVRQDKPALYSAAQGWNRKGNQKRPLRAIWSMQSSGRSRRSDTDPAAGGMEGPPVSRSRRILSGCDWRYRNGSRPETSCLRGRDASGEGPFRQRRCRSEKRRAIDRSLSP